MAGVFDTILTKGVRAGQIPSRTDSARKWYRDAASSYGRVSEQKLMKDDTQRLTNTLKPGNMYMYVYVH